MTALSLLDWQPRATMRDGLQARFAAFHAENPHVYAILVRLAREWRAVHGPASRVGIATLFEVARWQISMRTSGDEFRLNNSWRSRYARLLMREPGLDGLFETRELKS